MKLRAGNHLKAAFILTAICTTTSFIGVAAQAQTSAPPPDALQSDPKTHGMMQGFPPPPDKIVRFSDGSSSRFPNTRWAFSHIRELVPTANVSRGEGPVAPLQRSERDLG